MYPCPVQVHRMTIRWSLSRTTLSGSFCGGVKLVVLGSNWALFGRMVEHDFGMGGRAVPVGLAVE